MNQKGFANIAFVVVIVAIIAVGGYFIFIKKSEPIARQQTFTSTWKTFTNTKYGYHLQYPKTLRGPVSFCGGVGIDIIDPAEICNEVGINTEPVINPYWNPASDDSIIIRVFDNSGEISVETFVNKVLSRAILSKPVGVKKINNINSYVTTFSGALGGEFYKGKTVVLFIPIENNQILRVTYPVEFCFVVKKSDQLNQLARFTSPCYSDDRNKLYEQIVSTLLLNQ